MERLVEAEAKGESYEGKVAVATVVLNRVESSQFPDSITKVINQKNAFSLVQNGEIKKPASSEAKTSSRRSPNEKRSFTRFHLFLQPRDCNG